MKCKECKTGTLVFDYKNGQYSCDNCGLVSELVIFGNFRGDENVRESNIHKFIREKKESKKQHEKERNQRKGIHIYTDAHKVLKSYCKKHEITMGKFVSELIMENCL